MFTKGWVRQTYGRAKRERIANGNENENENQVFNGVSRKRRTRKPRPHWTSPVRSPPIYRSSSSDEFDRLLHDGANPEDTFQKLVRDSPVCLDPKVNLTYSSSSPITPSTAENKIKKTRKPKKHNFKSKKKRKPPSSENQNDMSSLSDYHLTVQSCNTANNASNMSQLILESIKNTSMFSNLMENSISMSKNIQVVETPKKCSILISSTPCKNTSYDCHSNANDISVIIPTCVPESHTLLKALAKSREIDFDMLQDNSDLVKSNEISKNESIYSDHFKSSTKSQNHDTISPHIFNSSCESHKIVPNGEIQSNDNKESNCNEESHSSNKACDNKIGMNDSIVVNQLSVFEEIPQNLDSSKFQSLNNFNMEGKNIFPKYSSEFIKCGIFPEDNFKLNITIEPPGIVSPDIFNSSFESHTTDGKIKTSTNTNYESYTKMNETNTNKNDITSFPRTQFKLHENLLKNSNIISAQLDTSITGDIKSLRNEEDENTLNISHNDEIATSFINENEISKNTSHRVNTSTITCENGHNSVKNFGKFPVVVLDRLPIVDLEDLKLHIYEDNYDDSSKVSSRLSNSSSKRNEYNISQDINDYSIKVHSGIELNDSIEDSIQKCNTNSDPSHYNSKNDITLKNSLINDNENTNDNFSNASYNSVPETPNHSLNLKFVTQRKTTMSTTTSMKSNNNISPIRPTFILPPGKRWGRHLNIIRNMSVMNDSVDHFNFTMHNETIHRGRKYKETFDSVLQQNASVFADATFHPNFISGRKSIVKIVEDFTLHEELLSNSGDDTGVAFSKLAISRYDRPSLISEELEEKSNWPDTGARDLVLRKCGQTEPLPFDECYPKRKLQRCWKIGEGVYGEVFLYKTENDPDNPIVMKVIPIEGNTLVNGEPQKKFGEIISEIVIAMELSDLRNNTYNNTSSFVKVHKAHCVKGSYPERLLTQWDLFDEHRGSENDYPNFNSDQLYIVLELEHGGKDLEAFEFSNAENSYALFFQIASALAVAEEACQFEHRDLHWGNILIKPTDEECIKYSIRGVEYSIPSCGVFANIIDFTLSRMSSPQFASTIYTDLANDDDLFNAGGDYQFSIYRMMREKNGNSWQEFHPYTNILWLHYILTKMINELHYKRVKSKIHKKFINKLKKLKDVILDYDSCSELVINEI